MTNEPTPLKVGPSNDSSYLGAGHQLSLWDKKRYPTLTAPYKGFCSAEDWSAIGTTKAEVRERWMQHLYGVMQKRKGDAS